MQIQINPITPRLKELTKQYGTRGWVVMNNSAKCKDRGDKPATLVCKDNKMLWLVQEEIK